MANRWQRLEEIFHGALEQPEEKRSTFVVSSCDGDLELLAEVESLLRYLDQRTTGFNAAVRPVAASLITHASGVENLSPGAMLGPYCINRKLGDGGMGSVYVAVDTRLGREVAIKLISGALAGTPEARARFVREARSVAALAHPNIAVLHDCGETEETPWLVMEYIRGASLRSRLVAGRMERSELLNCGVQIAAAIEHAHSRGILHRDIKPENVLITESGSVKVIDFGLAKAASEDATSPRGITKPFSFFGTPAYTAPELFLGGLASARSDVYSLGVVLYEMACGQHPFGKLTGASLAAAILADGRPGVAAGNPDLPIEIAELIERCMERDPAARYRDGTEVAVALRKIAAGEVPSNLAEPTPRLAILNFLSIGGAANTQWFGTGLAETLSADIAKLKFVRVANRGRVQDVVRRAGNPQDDSVAAVEIGRELEARWIVTGAYQEIGGRVRVTPKLIDAGTGDVLSIEKIDGRWDDLFDVQDRVVASLLQALATRVGASGKHAALPAETRNIMAFEHYVRGRQEMYEMQNKSLTAAIDHFEQAVTLDPGYALAYSALGTSHALQFLRTSNPEDVMRASEYLERAIALDPELGEPYPWLANIRSRKNDLNGAIAAGLKGVQLQPDLPEAHYFYGSLYYMYSECRGAEIRKIAPPAVSEAIRLRPSFHPAWLALGAVAMFVGEHDSAIQVLSEAIRMETAPDLIFRFVGARTLLGIALTRAGDWETARTQHLQALESLKDTDHVYRDTFMTLSACGLGDIELRCGNRERALAHYRHGHRIVKETPRMVGSARLLTRTSAGLAAAYAAVGDLDRARKLADEAIEQLTVLKGNMSTATFECGLAQLYLALAVAELRLNRRQSAAECLQHARETGWQDLPWLLTDPELRPLKEHPIFLSFVEALGNTPRVEIPVPIWKATPRLPRS